MVLSLQRSRTEIGYRAVTEQHETQTQLPRGATAILKLLYDVTREFSSSLELSVVLGKVLSLTVRSLGAAKGSLFMLDESGRVVKHILAREHLPPEVREQVVAVVMDKGLAGWVYRQRQGTIVADTETDDRWYIFSDDARVVRSVMSAPLVRRHQISGIITLEHPRPNAFVPADLDLLTTVAHQAAVAIENARLFTQVSQERDSVAAVLEGARDAILVVNGENHRLTMANPAAADLIGISLLDQIGRPIGELVPAPELGALLDIVQEGKSLESEIELHGRRHFAVNVQAIPLVGKVVALHDITHLKEQDRAKSEFVAAVSHDLKVPLGTILGYAWLLHENQDLTVDQSECVSSILESVERMQRLVSNLLDLARIEAGIDAVREMCDLPEIVNEVAVGYGASFKSKGVRFVVVDRNDPLYVLGNRLRLSQVVSNLISNGLKYTPEGGSVSVETRLCEDVAVLVVADTGPGISPEDQARLFQRFSRVGGKEMLEIAGTGLGLAIVRSVVESHGGRVWVNSDIGSGSTFTVALPLADPDAGGPR